MAEIRNVLPAIAHSLQQEGYVYVDVRSEPEFEAGHPPAAYNIPLQHFGDFGLEPNPDFLAVFEARFPKDTKLILGCKAGGRSRKAIELLASHGYETLVDQTAGWDGKRDAFGRLVPGWSRLDLPKEAGLPAERSYSALAQGVVGAPEAPGETEG